MEEKPSDLTDRLFRMWETQAEQQRLLGQDPRMLGDVDRRRVSADLILGLHEEVTELQRLTSHYKKHILSTPAADPHNVADEIADILKLTLSIAQLHGLELPEVVEAFHRKTNVVASKAEGERLRLKSQTKLICVDLDDVVCDLRAWHEEESRLRGGAERNGRTLQMIEAWKADWHASGRFRRMPVIEGAPEALRRLKAEGYRIVFITARPQWQYKRIHADTLEWLQEHSVPHDLILFNKDKLEAIHEHLAPAWPVAFIEDHERNARHLSAAGVRVLLFDQPHNRHLPDGENIHRVKSWEEILESLT